MNLTVFCHSTFHYAVIDTTVEVVTVNHNNNVAIVVLNRVYTHQYTNHHKTVTDFYYNKNHNMTDNNMNITNLKR